MLSACIIAKNEERYIGRLLDSLKGCPEIIVLDTGSTDRTKEISKTYPNVRVENFKWTGSFADARNAAMTHATHDWALWLDADMFFRKGDFAKLLALLPKVPSEFDAVGLTIVDPNSSFVSPRVCRSYLRFKYRIHEELDCNKFVPAGISLLHDREETEAEVKAKREEQIRLFKAELVDDPKSAHAIRYLRDFALGDRDWTTAQKLCFELLEVQPAVDYYNQPAVDYYNYVTLAHIAYQQNSFEEALRMSLMAFRYCTSDPRVLLGLADAFMGLDQRLNALVCYKLVLALPAEARFTSTHALHEDNYNVFPLIGIARIYALEGQAEQALDCLQKALVTSPNTICRELIEANIKKLERIPS